MQDSKTFSSNMDYLDDSDFSKDGKLLRNDRKVGIVMIQANFCFHCTSMKPDFQKFFDKNKDKYYIACVQGDDDKPEVKKLMARINTIMGNFSGYPAILLFSPSGKFLHESTAPRTYDKLVKFAESVKRA